VYHERVKVLLSYALALGGLGLMIYVVVTVLSINLLYPGARLAMLNALRTSVNQADYLCTTVPGTFFEAIGSAIKLGAMAGTTDISILAQTTRPGYDATIPTIKQKWKTLFGHGKKAILLAIGGAALAISQSANPALHIIISVVVLGAAIWVFIAKLDTERSMVRARAELLPELDRAFAEGRYQVPGAPPKQDNSQFVNKPW
jgi:hypothetical protein